jgi:multimeric flavodoxin WrbA
MAHAAVIYGGSRPAGNAALLADIVAEGIAVERIRVDRYPVEALVDHRHDAEGFGQVGAGYRALFDRILDAGVWIIASPIYWYGFPANLKAFIDEFSHLMRRPEYRFRERMQGKVAVLVLAGGDNPRLKGLPLVNQFYWIADFLGMDFRGYVIGEGDRPGEVLQDGAAVSEAQRLNQIVKDLL